MNIIHVNNGQFFGFDGKTYLKIANQFFCMNDLDRPVGFHDDCGIEGIVGQIACSCDGVVRTFHGTHEHKHNLGDEIVVTCYFCNTRIPPTTDAIDDGWLPSFWDDEIDEELLEPVCPNCQKAHLHFDEEQGDYVRKVAVKPY